MPLDRTSARHGLPHPLALLYDRLNQPDPWRRLEDLLAFTEGVARYLAWILTAEAAALGAPVGRLRSDMKANAFGSFLHVIHGALKARAGQSQRFLPELDAWTQGAALAFLDEVNRARNHMMHHRVARDPRVASEMLRAFEPGLQALLDALGALSRHPLGVLRAAQGEHDGAMSAHWLACRGLSLRAGNVAIRNVAGLPTDQPVLLDLDQGRALTLAPFFLCDENAFYWLDLPHDTDASRASAYVRPTAGDPVAAWLPKQLFDVTRSEPNGLPLARWLDAPHQRPRIVLLRLDVDSIARIRSLAVPTQTGAGLFQPAASVLSGAPSPSVPPAPPAATPSAPPHTPTPASPSLPAQGVAVSTAPARAPRRWALLAAAGVIAAIAGASWVGLRTTRSDTEPSPDAPRATSAPPPAEPSRPPAPSSDRPLTEHPQLRAWLFRWAASATGTTFVDSTTGQSFPPEPIAGFYAPVVSYHNVRGVTPATAAERWGIRHLHNRFGVDLARGVWLPELQRRLSDGCKRTPGDGPVLLVSIPGEESGEQVIRPRHGATCPRVAGPYLLQVKQVEGNWRICMESWHEARAVCASCPQMCVNGSAE